MVHASMEHLIAMRVLVTNKAMRVLFLLLDHASIAYVFSMRVLSVFVHASMYMYVSCEYYQTVFHASML